MAFDNVTFFELHFDGARFGPQFGSDDEESEFAEDVSEEIEEIEEMEMEMDTEMDEVAVASGRRGRLAPVIGLLALVGVAAFVVRRRSRRGEMDVDEIDVDIEHVDADPIEQ